MHQEYLKRDFTDEVSGVILKKVREQRGRLTKVSDMCQINRRMFNHDEFCKLKLYQVLRLLYAICVDVRPKEFEEMLTEMRDVAKKYFDMYEEDLLCD